MTTIVKRQPNTIIHEIRKAWLVYVLLKGFYVSFSLVWIRHMNHFLFNLYHDHDGVLKCLRGECQW